MWISKKLAEDTSSLQRKSPTSFGSQEPVVKQDAGRTDLEKFERLDKKEKNEGQ